MNPLLTKLSASTVAAVMLLSPAFALASHSECEHGSRGATVTNSGQSAKHGDEDDKKEGAEHRATVRNNGKSEKHGSGVASTTPARDRDKDHDEECDHDEYHTATTTVSWQNHGDHHKHATTTPPVATTTIPVIGNVTANPATTTASIAWQTSTAANGTVYYGTAWPFNLNASTTLSTTNASMVTGHVFTLSGLTASTTYYFVVKSVNPAGAATSTTYSFVTKPAGSAPVLSSIAHSATANSVNVSWVTDTAADGTVYLGTSTPFDLSASTTASSTSPAMTIGHSATFLGLVASTTYSYVVQSANVFGSTISSVFSFVTGLI